MSDHHPDRIAPGAGRRRPRARWLGLCAAGAALAALGLASWAASASDTVPSQSGAAGAWHRFVACARTHGAPNLPEPQVDVEGRAHLPYDPGPEPESVRAACQAMLDGLPLPSSTTTVASPPLPPAQLRLLVRFAGCMRDHGIFDWSDPDPDGVFAMDRRLLLLGKGGGVSQAMQACERFNPDPQGRIQGRAVP